MKKRILSDDSVSVFCLEMAEAIKSGITVSESFLLLSEQEHSPEIKTALVKAHEDTDAGLETSIALEEMGLFPEHMIKMIRVAERTGTTESVFRELSTYYKRQAALQRTLKSTVAYPALLLVIILAVFFVFLTEVLPVFDSVFSQIGAQMMPAAEVFMNFGLALANAKWIILGVIAVIAVLVVIAITVEPIHDKVMAVLLNVFSKGKTGKAVTTARLASVLSLAVTGTRDMAEALELSGDFAKGTPGEESISKCAEAVMAGESLAKVAEETNLFTPVYCRMINIGERTGSTDTMMREIASRTQDEMDTAIQRLTGRVEPAAVVILSVCVGLLLLSVMLPLVGIMSAL